MHMAAPQYTFADLNFQLISHELNSSLHILCLHVVIFSAPSRSLLACGCVWEKLGHPHDATVTNNRETSNLKKRIGPYFLE